MEELVGKIVLVVRGQSYEAGIERISAEAANPRSPWQKEDQLHVWLSFESGEGKYPGATLSFGITLPVKDYKPDELLALIKKEGELRLEEIELKSDEDRAFREARDARQQELDAVASQLNKSMKEASKLAAPNETSRIR